MPSCKHLSAGFIETTRFLFSPFIFLSFSLFFLLILLVSFVFLVRELSSVYLSLTSLAFPYQSAYLTHFFFLNGYLFNNPQ